MGRVWTLQELAMPLYILLTSPGKIGHQRENNVPEAYLLQLQEDLGVIMNVVSKAYETRLAATPSCEAGSDVQAPLRILEAHRKTDPVLACMYSDYRRLFEMVASIGRVRGSQADMARSNRNETLKLYLNSFATSQRKALYPVDYVYGVLGILDIDIPPMDDPKQVWHMFSEKLRKRHPDIDVPEHIDLSKATKMEDVYGHFGFPHKDNFVSVDVLLDRVRFY
ncbi:hypothetical protein BX666DRAFT_1905326 [Dichotomocladium elegans]|nr:hypothetical protein BX666DRAFT_1905326 [Dichotomocladium elegans]